MRSVRCTQAPPSQMFREGGIYEVVGGPGERMVTIRDELGHYRSMTLDDMRFCVGHEGRFDEPQWAHFEPVHDDTGWTRLFTERKYGKP
jgi:hypothetical protein